MANFRITGVQVTPREVEQFDTYMQKKGSGKGLVKLGLIGTGIVASIYGAYRLVKWGIDLLDENTKNKSKASAGGGKPQPLVEEVPYEEVPPTFIDDPRRAAIEQLVSGEDVDDLEDITPQALDAAPETNVMQGVIHQGLNLLLAEKKCGKTILAVHVGVCMAKGQPSELFTTDEQRVVRQRVVYYDTETGRSAMNRYHGEELKEVLGRGFYLREGSTEWEKLRDDIAAQVVDHQCESKEMTFILDCIYEYKHHQLENLRKALKKLRKNAREKYGVNVTIIAVTHLNEKGDAAGSENLQREAVMWINLERICKEEDKKSARAAKRDEDKKLLSEVSISWTGRYPEAGRVICIAIGEKEGCRGNLHFERKPLDWMEAKKDSVLAEQIKELAHTEGGLYLESNTKTKVDSECLRYVAKRVLSETNVAVNTETLRTWLNNMDSIEN